MRLVRIIAVAVAFALSLAACGSGGSSTKTSGTTTGSSTAPTMAPASGTAINASQTGLGSVLVDAQGRTLYHLTKESATNIVCTGSCLSTWPPVTVPAGQQPQAGAGVTGALSVVTRPDGTLQAAANGYPLYTYSGDTKAGDTNGQGVAGVWFAVLATGSSAGGGAAPAATTPATAAPPTTTYGGTGGTVGGGY